MDSTHRGGRLKSTVQTRVCKCEITCAHHADLIQHASTDKHKNAAQLNEAYSHWVCALQTERVKTELS